MLHYLIDGKSLWLRRTLGLALIVIFVARLAFGTLIGIFFLSWILYIGLPYFTSIEPWDLKQLVLWFDELGNDAKVGLASSLVTVLGFFIALHITMLSWRRQTSATMRMAAADAIDAVISEVNEILLRIALFTEAAAKETLSTRDQGLPPESVTMLSVLSEQITEFRANRQRLLQLEQEVIALPPRHAILFLPLSGIEAALDAVAQNLSTVTQKVFVQAPTGGTGHPDHRRHFFDLVDPVKYKELAEASITARDNIATIQGGIRGALWSPMLEINSVSFGRIVRHMFK